MVETGEGERYHVTFLGVLVIATGGKVKTGVLAPT